MNSFSLDWPPADEPTPLASGSIHVWAVRLDTDSELTQSLRGILAEDELQRADRFYFDQHRRRFIAARGALRNLLGAYQQAPAAEIQFRYGPKGKPSLAAALAGGGLQFNVAHSEEVALVAIACGIELGVDVEFIRDLGDSEAMVRRFFAPSEGEALNRLPREQRRAAFFDYWTCKEAVVKSLGEGLSISPERIVVDPAHSGPALLSLNDQPAAADWRIARLAPATGYAGALAWQGPAARIVCRSWAMTGAR